MVRLEARPANVEGAGAVTLRDLVRQALRMRPDRLVVGEVRGAEVVDLLAALNTGHQRLLIGSGHLAHGENVRMWFLQHWSCLAPQETQTLARTLPGIGRGCTSPPGGLPGHHRDPLRARARAAVG